MFFRKAAEHPRRSIGIELLPPRKEYARDAPARFECGGDPLPRLAGKGREGEEDEMGIPEAGGGDRFGEQREIAALVQKALLPQEPEVPGKQQGKVGKLSAQRSVRFRSPVPEHLFIHAGRHELRERFIDGAGGTLPEKGKLPLLLGEKGGDRHHGSLLGEQLHARPSSREKARERCDFGEHGPLHGVKDRPFREQRQPVLAEDERFFPF